LLHLKDKIIEVIQPELNALGVELVDIDFSGIGKKSIIRLYIDSKSSDSDRCGVSIGDCEKVSKSIQRLLEIEELVKGDYTLEVSTPGIERPLTKLADYERFKGKLCKVVIRAVAGDDSKESCFTANIKAVVKDNIIFDINGEERTVNIEDIKKANLKFER
jgi:ribosome maturation factor RimP